MEVIKVAIVEDIDEIRESLRQIVNTAAGFECIHAYADALIALENIVDLEVDVLLLDVNLPHLSGPDAVRLFKEKHPDMQIIMCTIYSDDNSVFTSLKNGASGYLLKKVPPSQMIEAIREVHMGGAPMSSEIARRVVDSFKMQSPKDFDVLTNREKQILDRLERGLMYKEIAEDMNITIDTVKKHIHNVYSKLHVQSRTGAIKKLYGKK